jgi:hypothetical protein
MWNTVGADPLLLLYLFFIAAALLAALWPDTPGPLDGSSQPPATFWNGARARFPKNSSCAVFPRAPRPDTLVRG